MLSIILSFMILFGVFFLGIKAVRETTLKQKLSLTKLVGYSILCAVLAVSAMSFLVIMF